MHNRKHLYLQAALVVAALVFLNLLGSRFFQRWDLTADQRYTLTDNSITLLDTLPIQVSVKVYLDGQLPAQFKRFRDAVETHLREMQVHAGDRLDYLFADPAKQPALQRELASRGISPLNTTYRKTATQTEQLQLFPVAIVSAEGREIVIDLMKGNYFDQQGQPDLAGAEQELEYQFAAAFQRLLKIKKPLVGFLIGHGEHEAGMMPQWLESLSEFYKVMPVEIDSGEAIPSPKSYLADDSAAAAIKGEGLEALVIAQPKGRFREREKYEIDQYIMRGGKVLWLLDQQLIDREGLMQQGASLTTPLNLNLDDQFQQYGFRVNYNLLQDLACDWIFLKTRQQGRERLAPRRWVYYPKLLQIPHHPVTKNVDGVLLRYASTLDSLSQPDLAHRVILQSSPRNRTLDGAVTISFQELLGSPPPPQVYAGNPQQIVGLAIEGKFRSVFANRPAPTDSLAPNPPSATFIRQNPYPNRMVVFSDGDLPLPHRLPGQGVNMPYDNLTLLLNAIDYLVGDNALTQIRSREVSIRKLDREQVIGRVTTIQLLNVAAPLALVLALGWIRFWRRKQKNKQYQVDA